MKGIVAASIILFSIDINYYNKNVTVYHTNSNYSTTLQGRYHGERKDNDYPMANKKTHNTKPTLQLHHDLKTNG